MRFLLLSAEVGQNCILVADLLKRLGIYLFFH